MNLCFMYTIMYLTLFMKLDLPTFGKLKSMTHLLKFHKYLVWIFFSFLISTCIYHIRRDLEKHLPVKFNAKALSVKKFLCTLYMYSNKVLALKFKHRYLSAELWLTHRLVEFLCLGLLMEVLPHAVELHISRNKMSWFEIKFIHFWGVKNTSFGNKSCKICHVILFVFHLPAIWLIT